METKINAVRYHDISCGHRVHGHESVCAHLHGHNYRIYFTIEGQQDHLGRVIDFGVIKRLLCTWLDNTWDHKFLISDLDPWGGVCPVPFNPTAENMALYLLETIGPRLLKGTNTVLARVVVHETRKCSAEVSF
jgi:6-pyruvoyltetrahydropterin/6-carboxytetrahydropterin synthase